MAEDPSLNLGTVSQPYEVISSKIQSLAHRTSLDSFVFPITTLLPEVCRYSVMYAQDGRIGAQTSWPVQLFLSLGVSHDMVIRMLGNIFDTQDFGFSGPARGRIIEFIIHVVDDWLAEIRRRGGVGSLTPIVSELLEASEATLPSLGPNSNLGGAAPEEMRRVIAALRREVGNVMERAPSGSTRYY